MFIGFMWAKTASADTQKLWPLFQFADIAKTDSQPGKKQQKRQAKSLGIELCKSDFPVMGKMEETVKMWMGNANQLQTSE